MKNEEVKNQKNNNNSNNEPKKIITCRMCG